MKLSIKATPNAKKNEVTEDVIDMFGMRCLKVKVNQPPEDGKANVALIELLSKYLGVRKSEIKIVQGLTSRNKIIELAE
jgi:uncharacterized protein (TIGR00251 family)